MHWVLGWPNEPSSRYNTQYTIKTGPLHIYRKVPSQTLRKKD